MLGLQSAEAMARRLLAALAAIQAAALLPPTRRPSTALRAALTELPTQQPENPVAEAEIRYDPEKAQKLLTRQPRRWLSRNVQLFFPLAGFIMSIISDRAMNCEPQRREQRASELLELISNLGPAVIKGGQALASRPDLCRLGVPSCGDAIDAPRLHERRRWVVSFPILMLRAGSPRNT